MNGEVKFCENSKKPSFFFFGGGGGRGSGRVWGRGRVDVNEQFLCKLKKMGVSGRVVGSGWGRGGVRVNVNEELKFL